MFKSTSDNSQNRELGLAQNSRINQNGIDPTTWATGPTTCATGPALSEERGRLLMRKRELEHGMTAIKLKIGDAHARRSGFRSGKPTDNVTFRKWCSDRDRMLAEFVKIENRLSEIKLQRISMFHQKDAEKEKRNTDKSKQFECVFFKMAKELLAGPVYDRLVAATIHRCAEGEQ